MAECQELAAGRYPLAAGSGVDLPLADFSRIFGPSGTYDGFMRTTMQSFVDTNRTVWRWKPEAASIGGAASVPAQFQRASRIMQTYFPAGGTQPEVRFTVTPDFLDAAASRMTLEIDGQTLEFRHGPQRSAPMVARPLAGSGSDQHRGAKRCASEPCRTGPGAVQAPRQGRASGSRRNAVSRDFHARGAVCASSSKRSSSRNPFARDLLHGFSCQG
jgi:type VI secretion system protein ImpL